MKFPAMYSAADDASRNSQLLHFFSFAAEFLMLIVIAVVNSQLRDTDERSGALVLCCVVFAIIALTRRFMDWEKKWYQSRALAESIKTTAWRYAMRAAPFDLPSGDGEASKRFRDFLTGILRANRQLGNVITANDVGDEQISSDMNSIRILSVFDRIELYKSDRIDNQQSWYSVKSKINKQKKMMWFGIICVIFSSMMFSIFYESFSPHWMEDAFDPLLVLLTGLVGWVEVKRYGELSASYGITSHEIGIIRSQVDIVQDEESLSDFVNEAERAFSREHTQWLARSEVEL